MKCSSSHDLNERMWLPLQSCSYSTCLCRHFLNSQFDTCSLTVSLSSDQQASSEDLTRPTLSAPLYSFAGIALPITATGQWKWSVEKAGEEHYPLHMLVRGACANWLTTNFKLKLSLADVIGWPQGKWSKVQWCAPNWHILTIFRSDLV